MTQGSLRTGYACLFALALGAGLPAAQTATNATPGVNQTDTVTIEGCLMKEADVPGRRPPEADRSTVIAQNNFVLTDTAVKQGAAPADARGPLLYMVRDLKKGELNGHAGHRVQIDGRLDKVQRARNPVTFANSLVEIKGTAIRRVSEGCAK